MTESLETSVGRVRAFNRFYTRRIGVLGQSVLHTSYTLTEARVLYEIGHRDDGTASELADALAIDAGQLSRVLAGLEERRLVRKVACPEDGRCRLLRLTAKGRRAVETLDRRSHDEIAALLEPLAGDEVRRLTGAMETIHQVLDPEDPSAPVIVRGPRAGDYGWVIERHGALYAEAYGWDASFEVLVGEVMMRFVRDFDPERERMWVAEQAGERVGTVFVAKASDRVAQLRLLLVEPRARGQGIGRHLVEQCIDFSRQAGYEKLTLWTQRNLEAARRIYAATGFELVHEEPHHSFGHDLIAETWDLVL